MKKYHKTQQKNDRMKTYLANDSLSSSDLKNMAKSTMHFLYGRETEKEPSFAMIEGSLIHTLILEPHRVAKDFVILDMSKRPENTKTMGAKANKEWMAEIKEAADKEGQLLVKDKTLENCENVAYAVSRNKIAMELLKDTYSEQSFYTTLDYWGTNIPLKIRPDAIKKAGKGNIMISIKTTKDASPSKFSAQAHNLLYNLSDAMYLRVLKQVTGIDFELYTIAIEKTAPYMVQVYDCTAMHKHVSPLETFDYLNIGDGQLSKAIERYVMLEKENISYDYSAGQDREDGIVDIGTPAWANFQSQSDFE